MLIINIMQKILNMHRFALYTLLQRTLLNSKAGLLAGLTLLLLAGAINPVEATGFIKDFVTLTTTGTSTTSKTYYTNTPTTGTTKYQGSNLGSFDRNANTLLLTSEANLTTTGRDNVKTVQLLYRVYPQGTAGGNFVPMALALQKAKGKNSQWINKTSNPNLLAAIGVTNGTYVLEVFFQASVVVGTGTIPLFDNNSGSNYTATFDVKGSPIPTQWTALGGNTTRWFDPNNWSTGQVPDSSTDVIINPNNLGPNNTGKYPILDEDLPFSRVAKVRNLRIVGKNDGSVRAQNATINLAGGKLAVYGDFQDTYNGFNQTKGIFYLAGGNQIFDGATTFTDIQILGGGTKTLTLAISVLNTLTFTGSKGSVLSTGVGNDNRYNVTLQGAGARVVGESETSYVKGTLRSIQPVGLNQTTDFGGIGVDLIVNSNTSPGSTFATRTSSIYNGEGTSVSIQRNFTFLPTVDTDQKFSLVFHYLNADLNGIAPNNLVMFRSVNNGIPFEPLHKTSNDPVNKTLTRTGITGTLAALFTLGDATNPLPVGLTSFTAVAQGPDAVLAWATAQETNNKGFEVQVSGDGAAFRTLGFVAAETPNSAAARSYRFRDTEGGKQGTRYYRLRQLDLDGGESFFGPQAVAFGARARTASALGYPNPFGAELTLALQTLAAGPAAVSLFDMTGRQVRTYQPTLAAGASSVRLDDLQSLPHGLYVVQVRYSDGQTQRLKLIKE